MFRLSLHSRRSVIHQSTTVVSCLNSRTLSQTCRLQEGGNLYSKLLADVQQEDKVQKVPIKRGRPPKTAKTPPTSKDDKTPATASKRTKRPKPAEHTTEDGVKSGDEITLEPKKARKTRVAKPKFLSPEQVKVKADRAALQEMKMSRMPIGLLQNPWSDILRFLASTYKSHTYLGDNKRAHVISHSLCGKQAGSPIRRSDQVPNSQSDRRCPRKTGTYTRKARWV